MRPRSVIAASAVLTAVALSVSGGCSGCRGAADSASSDSLQTWPDTLRVGILYSPGGYFIYRDQEMGYDYNLVKRLCSDKNMELALTVERSLPALIQKLDSGKIDIIAADIPITGVTRRNIIYCGPSNETTQVLVQPRDGDMISDVTQLAGHTIWVEDNSKYQSRLHHLNDEIGGGIDIHTVRTDTLNTEDLVDMVNDGSIPMTIADSDIARACHTYYPGLDVSVRVSLPQRSAWGTDRQWLADSIDAWFGIDATRQANTELLNRYYELSKTAPASPAVDLTHGRISPYDDYFRKYAAQIGWDWRLLAAIGWAESRFDPTLTSWAGARGIMQIMPVAAQAYGSTADAVADPETGIRVGAKIVAALDKALANDIPDADERRKFVLASYNAGIAHIRDAMVIARYTGHDPTLWHANVADALMLKSHPEYYNLEGCRAGYFRGRQTYQFVDRVLEFYQLAKRHIPL